MTSMRRTPCVGNPTGRRPLDLDGLAVCVVLPMDHTGCGLRKRLAVHGNVEFRWIARFRSEGHDATTNERASDVLERRNQLSFVPDRVVLVRLVRGGSDGEPS